MDLSLDQIIKTKKDKRNNQHLSKKNNNMQNKKPMLEFKRTIINEYAQDRGEDINPNRIMRYTPHELKMRKKLLGSERAIVDRKKFLKEFDISKLNMSTIESEIYDCNPHIQQVFANRKPFVRPGRGLVQEDRILTGDSPMSPYQRREGEAKTVDHWGQRKLLFSEIEFLLDFGFKGAQVVYAGAAPGTHTNYLSKLFPDIDFVLIDPAPFQAKESDRIKIMKDTYFNDELAETFKDKDNILFISDIRSGLNAMEKQAEIDMENQKRWHSIIKPKASMFKFRLPYTKGTTKYLDGTIYFPIWGGRTTTETRLIVDSQEEKDYVHEEYESKCFHFNTVTRTTYFEHNVVGEGLCHCYDCASEIFVLGKYLNRYPGECEKDSEGKIIELDKYISKMSYQISREISRDRTLDLSNIFN